jgi:hypothetical protein
MKLCDVRIDIADIQTTDKALKFDGINVLPGFSLHSIQLQPPSAAPGREIELTYEAHKTLGSRQAGTSEELTQALEARGLSVLADREREVHVLTGEEFGERRSLFLRDRRARTDEGRLEDAPERTGRIT